MREKVKTATLLVLILVGFQLTSMFWLQARTPLAVVGAGGTPGPTAEVPQGSYLDLYAPLFIYLHSGADHYQLRVSDNQYQLVWDKLKGAVAKTVMPAGTETVPLVAVDTDEWQQATSKSLEFRFSGQVELNFWWLAASKSTLQKISNQPLFFDRILIPLDDSYAYFRNLQTNQVWRWQWSSQLNAAFFPGVTDLPYSTAQRMREVVTPAGIAVASAADLLVARRQSDLPEVLATLPFSQDEKAGIVKQFFSITPRVTKTDTTATGGVLESYITAKQQILRLRNTGQIEFTETVKQSADPWSTLSEQLEQAFAFISTHGGKPETVISAGIKQVGSSGYQFDFVQVHGGYPVVDLLPSTLSVQVMPDGIKSYTRKVYNILQNGPFRYEIRSAEDALSVVGAHLTGRRVTDIYLGYYQREDVSFSEERPFDSQPMYLFPVWVVELNDGQQLLVHAIKLLNDPGVITPE